MEIVEEISRYKDFFEKFCLTDIQVAINSGQGGFIINFSEIMRFNVELSDGILDTDIFAERLKVMDIALKQVVEGIILDSSAFEKKRGRLEIWFDNLPASQFIQIKDIRGEDLGRVFQIEAIIKNTSEVRHRSLTVNFECPSCGTIHPVVQLEKKLKQLERCGCGFKGKMRIVNKKKTDHQWVEVQEVPEKMKSGSAAVHKKVGFVEGALCDKSMQGRLRPGARVVLTVVPIEIPGFLSEKSDETITTSVLQINYVRPTEQEFDDIVLSDKDIEDIESFTKEHKEDIMNLFVGSLAPSIYGYDEIKESIVLMLFGGVDKRLPGGGSIRGNFHILLIGDPSSGKSQILKQVQEVAPKARFTVGGSTSAVGLSASVVRNDITGEFSLEAGVLVLADKGIVLYDEFDKSKPEDRTVLHEALEQCEVTISKANINVSLPANICLLAAANPKLGRFDIMESFYSQIDLPPALASRFDLIWTMRDVPEVGRDGLLSDFVLEKHRSPDSLKPVVDLLFFRKFVAYAKQHCFPVLGIKAKKILKEYYMKKREISPQEQDGGFQSIAITVRHLDALVRLAEASAKTGLRSTVSEKDARRAIRLIEEFLNTMSVDTSTGTVDVDALFTGVASSTRSAISIVREALDDLTDKVGNIVPIDDLEAATKDRVDADKFEEVLERLRRQGDIMEPKRGFIQKL